MVLPHHLYALPDEEVTSSSANDSFHYSNMRLTNMNASTGMTPFPNMSSILQQQQQQERQQEEQSPLMWQQQDLQQQRIDIDSLLLMQQQQQQIQHLNSSIYNNGNGSGLGGGTGISGAVSALFGDMAPPGGGSGLPNFHQQQQQQQQQMDSADASTPSPSRAGAILMAARTAANNSNLFSSGENREFTAAVTGNLGALPATNFNDTPAVSDYLSKNGNNDFLLAGQLSGLNGANGLGTSGYLDGNGAFGGFGGFDTGNRGAFGLQQQQQLRNLPHYTSQLSSDGPSREWINDMGIANNNATASILSPSMLMMMQQQQPGSRSMDALQQQQLQVMLPPPTQMFSQTSGEFSLSSSNPYNNSGLGGLTTTNTVTTDSSSSLKQQALTAQRPQEPFSHTMQVPVYEQTMPFLKRRTSSISSSGDVCHEIDSEGRQTNEEHENVITDDNGDSGGDGADNPLFDIHQQRRRYLQFQQHAADAAAMYAAQQQQQQQHQGGVGLADFGNNAAAVPLQLDSAQQLAQQLLLYSKHPSASMLATDTGRSSIGNDVCNVNSGNHPAVINGTSLQLVDFCAAEAANRREKKRKTKSFPDKLHQAMTEYAVTEEAVAWLPDGKSFVIVNPDLFVTNVMAPVFKQCKYASFVRKLHRWGFARLTSGTGTDCFHHPLFQKRRKDLASKIVCSPRERDSSRTGGAGNGTSVKPPSLAGVERFIQAKAAAVAAAAELATTTTFSEGSPTAFSVIDSDTCFENAIIDKNTTHRRSHRRSHHRTPLINGDDDCYDQSQDDGLLSENSEPATTLLEQQ